MSEVVDAKAKQHNMLFNKISTDLHESSKTINAVCLLHTIPTGMRQTCAVSSNHTTPTAEAQVPADPLQAQPFYAGSLTAWTAAETSKAVS